MVMSIHANSEITVDYRWRNRFYLRIWEDTRFTVTTQNPDKLLTLLMPVSIVPSLWNGAGTRFLLILFTNVIGPMPCTKWYRPCTYVFGLLSLSIMLHRLWHCAIKSMWQGISYFSLSHVGSLQLCKSAVFLFIYEQKVEPSEITEIS